MTNLDRAAGLQNPLQKVFPQPVIASRAPTASDKKYPIGQNWVDKVSNLSYILTSVSAGSASWGQLSSGSSTADITFNSLSAKYVNASGIDHTFDANPVMQSADTGGGVATGATGDVNLMGFNDFVMESFLLGAGQTIISSRMDASGLNIALDQVDNEGQELNFGAARANSPHAFTVGTSAAFLMEATLKVADVSGCDPLLMGFRKSAANNATMASYTDYACMGLDATAAAGFVVLSTELNAGGTTNTDTTDAWADAASHKLSVLVSAGGVVTYLIDDVAPTVTAAFTLDDGDVVVPFIHFLNGSDVAGDVHLVDLKIGFQ